MTTHGDTTEPRHNHHHLHNHKYYQHYNHHHVQVAGMMTVIVLHELLPTAHHYDPTDAVTTNALLVGMVVMALSLTLFLFK
jgi:hypothetical protein